MNRRMVKRPASDSPGRRRVASVSSADAGMDLGEEGRPTVDSSVARRGETSVRGTSPDASVPSAPPGGRSPLIAEPASSRHSARLSAGGARVRKASHCRLVSGNFAASSHSMRTGREGPLGSWTSRQKGARELQRSKPRPALLGAGLVASLFLLDALFCRARAEAALPHGTPRASPFRR